MYFERMNKPLPTPMHNEIVAKTKILPLLWQFTLLNNAMSEIVPVLMTDFSVNIRQLLNYSSHYWNASVRKGFSGILLILNPLKEHLFNIMLYIDTLR